MDHVRLYSTRLKPARQPEAVAAGFEGQCNPRDLLTGPDRPLAPAKQQGKQPFSRSFAGETPAGTDGLQHLRWRGQSSANSSLKLEFPRTLEIRVPISRGLWMIPGS